jgi:hypothetical protein
MRFKAILALIAISLFAISCHIGAKTGTQETPDEPDEIKAERDAPEDVIIGVGKAKEATDGESILLAQDYARADIASNLNTMVRYSDTVFAPVDGGEERREEITEAITNARLTGSVIQKLVKTNDGTWWCVVSVDKATIIHKTAITPVIISEDYYRYNSPDLSKVRTVKTIPDWVFNPVANKPDNSIYGIGAAKGRNDNDAIRLATERARRSVAHSLDSEITSVTRIVKSSLNPVEQEENDLSITSVYDDRTFDTVIINAAKTTDGTWWILLGCHIY